METNPGTIIFTNSRTCMHVMCYTIDVVMYSNMPQASIKHYFLPCRILHVNVQEMCKKKREFLQCRYNTYTHMYKLSVRLSIKPSRLIYKHGVQVVISQCVCSSSFLNQHLKNFSTMKKIFLSEVLGGRG